MRALAKVGFTQSYTYFTWRNFKEELTEYLEELTRSEMAEYFRGNFFVNTPDILPEVLQRGGPPAFRMRAALAATLSSVWGIYSGFELCEATPLPGTEEYRASEKYEIRVRDWNAPGNISDYIARLNAIRRENPALHAMAGLRFYPADNPHVLFYGKLTPARDNVILVAVNLDPFATHEATLADPARRDRHRRRRDLRAPRAPGRRPPPRARRRPLRHARSAHRPRAYLSGRPLAPPRAGLRLLRVRQ